MLLTIFTHLPPTCHSRMPSLKRDAALSEDTRVQKSTEISTLFPSFATDSLALYCKSEWYCLQDVGICSLPDCGSMNSAADDLKVGKLEFPCDVINSD